MNYAKIDKNDITNGEGVCVSLWVSGCELHCPGCHNSEIWSFTSGALFAPNTLEEIFYAIAANGIQRNFSVLGGEPLAPQNIEKVAEIVHRVREKFPNIKIYLWTGYEIAKVINGSLPIEPRANSNVTQQQPTYCYALNQILDNIDYLIDGQYVEAKRNITLPLRGSSNQKIYHRVEGNYIDITEQVDAGEYQF